MSAAAPDVKHSTVCLPTQEQAREMAIRCVRSDVPRLQGLLWRRFVLWHQKRETRRALRDLTDTELLDIGLTRTEARKEASRSFFWD